MDVSKCTPGPWIAQERYDDTVVLAPDERPIAVLWFNENGSEEDNSRMFDDAQLIAEAGTVAHETGLSPRQLADRVKVLEYALRPLATWAEHERRELRAGGSDSEADYMGSLADAAAAALAACK